MVRPVPGRPPSLSKISKQVVRYESYLPSRHLRVRTHSSRQSPSVSNDTGARQEPVGVLTYRPTTAMHSTLKRFLPSLCQRPLWRRSLSSLPTNYHLALEQPQGSPIDTSQTSRQTLRDVDCDAFRVYNNVLSAVEQEQLLLGSLQRLDEIRGVSRAAKRRRKDLKQQSLSFATSNDCFLPVECYDFSEVRLSP